MVCTKRWMLTFPNYHLDAFLWLGETGSHDRRNHPFTLAPSGAAGLDRNFFPPETPHRRAEETISFGHAIPSLLKGFPTWTTGALGGESCLAKGLFRGGRFPFVGDGFPSPSSAPSVGARSLTAYGQSHAVATSPIATNVHETLDVHGFPTSQIPFYLVVIFYGFSQSRYFRVFQVFNSGIGVNLGLGYDFPRAGIPNAVNVGKGDFNPLVAR